MDSVPNFGNRPKALMCYICGREFGTRSLKIHIPQCIAMWEKRESLKPKRERRPVPQPPKQSITGGSTWAEINAHNAAAQEVFEDQAMKECPNCHRTFLEDRLVIHLKSCRPDRILKPLLNTKRNIQQEETKESVSQAASPAKPIRVKANAQQSAQQSVQQSAQQSAQQSTQQRAQQNTQQKAQQRAQQSAQQSAQSSASNLPPVEDEEPQELAQCQKCGRNFAVDRLQKHENVCKGPPKPKAQTQRQPEPPAKKEKEIPDWKKQHMDFVNNIRYAKKIKEVEEAGGDIRTVQAPKQMIDPYAGYVQCPYCGRKYAQETAERHIPKCKDIVNKPAPPPGRRGQPTARSLQPTTKQPMKSAAKARCSTCGREFPEMLLRSHMANCQSLTASKSNAALPGKLGSPYKLTPLITRKKTMSSTGWGSVSQLVGTQINRQGTRKNTLTKKRTISKPTSGAAKSCGSCGQGLIANAKFCAFCGSMIQISNQSTLF